jgi:hypothetical protein
MRTKICDTTHKTRNVGSLAVIADPTPLILTENVGSQSALFASPSLTVCGPRHLVLEPQESLGVVVEDLVDVRGRQARLADVVERLPIRLEGKQVRNGMKLASELLLYQLPTQSLPGFDHQGEALGPPFFDAWFHAMRSSGIDAQRS